MTPCKEDHFPDPSLTHMPSMRHVLCFVYWHCILDLARRLDTPNDGIAITS